eukprot:g21105.t1
MSFLLVTAFDDAYDVGFLCAASHEAYAQKHGYERLARGSAAGSASGSVNVESGWKTGRLERRSVCIARPLGSFRRRRELEIGRAPQWAKVALLQRLLHAIPGAKAEAVQPSWIVWLDADALLLDFETRLEDLLEDFDLKLGSPDVKSRRLLCWSHDADVVSSKRLERRDLWISCLGWSSPQIRWAHASRKPPRFDGANRAESTQARSALTGARHLSKQLFHDPPAC